MSGSRLTGRVALVTGGSSGIGREVVRELAWRAVTVMSASRGSGSGEAVAHEIRHETGNPEVTFLPVDLASLDSVRALAAGVRSRYDRLDLLLNHAGAYFGSRTITPDGFEATFAIHHLAHFLLTLELKPLLVAAGADDAPARSSGGYWVDERQRPPAAGARDPDVRRELWERSLDLVGAPSA